MLIGLKLFALSCLLASARGMNRPMKRVLLSDDSEDSGKSKGWFGWWSKSDNDSEAPKGWFGSSKPKKESKGWFSWFRSKPEEKPGWFGFGSKPKPSRGFLGSLKDRVIKPKKKGWLGMGSWKEVWHACKYNKYVWALAISPILVGAVSIGAIFKKRQREQAELDEANQLKERLEEEKAAETAALEESRREKAERAIADKLKEVENAARADMLFRMGWLLGMVVILLALGAGCCLQCGPDKEDSDQIDRIAPLEEVVVENPSGEKVSMSVKSKASSGSVLDPVRKSLHSALKRAKAMSDAIEKRTKELLSRENSATDERPSATDERPSRRRSLSCPTPTRPMNALQRARKMSNAIRARKKIYSRSL